MKLALGTLAFFIAYGAASVSSTLATLVRIQNPVTNGVIWLATFLSALVVLWKACRVGSAAADKAVKGYKIVESLPKRLDNQDARLAVLEAGQKESVERLEQGAERMESIERRLDRRKTPRPADT